MARACKHAFRVWRAKHAKCVLARQTSFDAARYQTWEPDPQSIYARFASCEPWMKTLYVILCIYIALRALAANAAGQLYVLREDGDTLRMNGAQVGVLVW